MWLFKNQSDYVPADPSAHFGDFHFGGCQLGHEIASGV
jgi:hypothetical protein